MSKAAATIDDYISTFPVEVQLMMEDIRRTIREAAPGATEAIKYAMPTFVLGGNLVHFAGFKNHIGFYPAPTGDPAFRERLSSYKTGKGSVQFPLNRPIPLELVKAIVERRMRSLGAEHLKRV